jgi:hypothetical protein
MKASMIVLLPVACLMQGALAAPAADNEVRAVAPPALKNRGLLDGLLGGLGGGSGGGSGGGPLGGLTGLLGGLLGGGASGIPDVTALPELAPLNSAVSEALSAVSGIRKLFSPPLFSHKRPLRLYTNHKLNS